MVFILKMINFEAVLLFIRILTCFISHRTFGNGITYCYFNGALVVCKELSGSLS